MFVIRPPSCGGRSVSINPGLANPRAVAQLGISPRSTMLINKVRFDGQTFLLGPDQDVDQLKSEIVAAVRRGSDFVDFETIGHGIISLLVTPSMPVRFQLIERTADELQLLEVEPPPLDEDAWIEHVL
jgi:hypothetical protein